MKLNFGSLRRVTSKGNFISEIDGLRFLAIVPVVLAHFNLNYKDVFGAEQYNSFGLGAFKGHASMGVKLFFAISGFILSYAFAKHFFINNKTFKQFDLKSYFLRRVTRLEPPYLISTIILFFFTGLFVAKSLTSILPNLLSTLTYTHSLIFAKRSVINPVTWSLEIEIQYYIIAPFIGAFFFSIKEWQRNLFLVLLIFLLPFLFNSSNSIFVTNPHLKRTVASFISYFLIGVLFASIYTSSYWSRIKKSYVFDVLGILCIFALFIYQERTVPTTLIGILTVMIASFKGIIVNKFFSNQIVATIGGMCYSIYLVHYATLFGLMKVVKRIHFENFYINYSFHIILTLFVVFVVSTLFFKFFEKPFMYPDWPHKLVSFFRKDKNQVHKNNDN